jgi:putative membrane protein
MRTSTYITVALTAAAVALSVPYARAQAGSQETSRQGAASQPTSAAQTDSQQFVRDMVIAGIAEIQMGQMASQRAQNEEVRAFGRRMMDEHGKANEELKEVASQLNVTPPTELDEKHLELRQQLSQEQGLEFDRAYIDAMVDSHEEVVNKLKARAGTQMTSANPAGARAPQSAGAATERDTAEAGAGASAQAGAATSSGAVGTAGSDAGEQALTRWAAQTLPVVTSHLEQARELQKRAQELQKKVTQ